MKKILLLTGWIFLAIFFSTFFNACVKDSLKQTYTYTYYKPVYKTRAEVKANVKSDAPQIIENPGKIVVLGNYIFLNEVDKGIHVIDNSNPASPQNISFISIPGNMDIAAKGNVLYADLYTDLVAIDISNPQQVVLKKYLEGVFPYRVYTNGYYNDTSKIICEWIAHDTTVTVPLGGERNIVYMDAAGSFFYSAASSVQSGKSSSSSIGVGGSTARFAIVDNRLYTVSNSDLNVFDIARAEDPSYKKQVNVGSWNVETIFPYKNKLFIGSQNGVYMYNINNPDNPSLIGAFAHVQSCDPVVVDDQYAYVTLRSGTACFGMANELDILKLNNYSDASLVKSYPFTNPHGLAKDANLLFICDGTGGFKVYDATDIANLRLVKSFDDIEPSDVIALGRIALVVAKDGLYQYDYIDKNNIHLVSRIHVAN